MLLPLKAFGLARNSATSIWSSDTPGRCDAPGDLRQRVARSGPGTRRREALPTRRALPGRRVPQALGARLRLARRRPCARRRCARALRRAPPRALPRAARRAARPASSAAAVPAPAARPRSPVTSTCQVPAARRRGSLPADRTASVYSRTSRPVAHEISRMTSTKGSWTPRSLTRRTNRRPSARFSNDGAGARQHRVVVDVGGAVGLGRGDADAQAGLLFRGQAGDFDLGAEHFAERRLDAEAAEAREPRREETRAERGSDAGQREAPRQLQFSFQGVSRNDDADPLTGPQERCGLAGRCSTRAPPTRPSISIQPLLMS